MNTLKKKVAGLAVAAVVALGVSGTVAPANAGTKFTVELPTASVQLVQAHGKNVQHWKKEKRQALNKKQIKRKLRAWGYRDFDKIERKGDRYIVKASWRGMRKSRLVLDAYSGRILKKR